MAWWSVLWLTILLPVSAAAEQPIHCKGDGDHLPISVETLKIRYDGKKFWATISGLKDLGARFQVESASLQQVAVVTQQWNEFLKGLAAGYNSCAITKKEYYEGLNRIYPRLVENITDLERLRKLLEEKGPVDEQRLAQRLEAYFVDLRRFGAVSHQEKLIEQALEEINRKLDLLMKLLPPPVEVDREIESKVVAKAKAAGIEYQKGYEFYKRHKVKEAIFHFEQALSGLKLYEFYAALGSALLESSNFDRAAQVFREGLILAQEDGNRAHEGYMASRLGEVFLAWKDYDEANKFLQQALQIHQDSVQQALETHKNLELSELALASDLADLGVLLYGQGELEKALASMQGALGIFLGSRSADPNELATLYNDIGMVLQAKGDLAGAKENVAHAILKLGSISPQHPDIATYQSNLSAILRARGELDEALKLIRAAITLRLGFVRSGDDAQMAVLYNNLAQLLVDRGKKGDLEEALRNTESALRINEIVIGKDHEDYAAVLNNRAGIFRDQGNLDCALLDLRRALSIYESKLGLEHPDTGLATANVGAILREMGDLAGSREFTERALAIQEKVLGPMHPRIAVDANNLGLTLRAQGEFSEAASALRRALAIDAWALGPEPPEVALHYRNLAAILVDKRNLDEALVMVQRALAIDTKLKRESANVASDTNVLGSILEAKGDLDGAVQAVRRALEMDLQVKGPSDPAFAEDSLQLGELLCRKGDCSAAIPLVDQAFRIFDRTYGPGNPKTKQAADRLKLLKAQGKT